MSRSTGPVHLARGTPSYHRANLALFLAGFSTFSLLYGVQPLLPEFSREFGVDPATSALSLSLATAALATAIFVVGAASQRVGQRGLMSCSLFLGACLNLAVAVAPTWPLLLAARLLQGLMLGGVPAVAMAYLAEQMEPRELGRAMGLYVAGTAFGGMMGRVCMGVLADFASWRVAMQVWGALGLLAAGGFAALLPRATQQFFRPALGLYHHLTIWTNLLRCRDLLRLFTIAFLIMSIFVSLFNYVGYRLVSPPYSLSQSAISLVSLTYILGVFGSSMTGVLNDRLGPRGTLFAGLLAILLGVLTTLFSPVPVIVAGIGLATAGFFVAHAVASGLVGRLSGPAKGQAAALYLIFYYAGSSLTGSAAGWFWEHGGWPAVTVLTGTLTLLALGLATGTRNNSP